MFIGYIKKQSKFFLLLIVITILFAGNSLAVESSLEITENGKVKIDTTLHLKPQSAFPANPEFGDLVCKTDGEIYIYKNDLWVNVIPPVVTPPVKEWVEIWSGSAQSHAFEVESNTTYRCKIKWNRSAHKHYVLIHIGDNSEVGHSMLGAGSCNVQYNVSPKRFDGWDCTILKIEKWQ